MAENAQKPEDIIKSVFSSSSEDIPVEKGEPEVVKAHAKEKQPENRRREVEDSTDEEEDFFEDDSDEIFLDDFDAEASTDSEDGDGPEDVEEEAENEEEIFLSAEDPLTGEKSVYKNREEAKEGLQRLLEYAGELKRQIDEVQKAFAEERQRLLGELEVYRGVMKESDAKLALVKAHLPEKFKNFDPTSTTDEQQLREYKLALIDAEVAVEKQIREAREAAAEEERRMKEAQDRAERHLRSRMSDLKFFGLRNAEDRLILTKKMSEKPPGSEATYRDIAMDIAVTYGNDVADVFLKSLVSPVQDNTGKKPAQEKVKKAKQIKTKAKRPKPVSRTEKVPMPTNARDILNAAWALKNKMS